MSSKVLIWNYNVKLVIKERNGRRFWESTKKKEKKKKKMEDKINN